MPGKKAWLTDYSPPWFDFFFLGGAIGGVPLDFHDISHSPLECQWNTKKWWIDRFKYFIAIYLFIFETYEIYVSRYVARLRPWPTKWLNTAIKPYEFFEIPWKCREPHRNCMEFWWYQDRSSLAWRRGMAEWLLTKIVPFFPIGSKENGRFTYICIVDLFLKKYPVT